ncbi:MAG: carbamate kinase [Burkholderiales bacterium]
MTTTVVIALGAAALLRRGDPLDANVQRANIARAVQSMAKIAGHHNVVVTHGNKPQVALLSLQAAAYAKAPPYPLDVLGAETEGMIGYLIEQELRNNLPKREVVTLLTQVEVSPDDPAFKNPSVLFGPAYNQEQAQRLTQERGWKMVAAGDQLWRRAVPSPEPLRILELNAIRALVTAGAVVVCAGGGGIPVTVTPQGMVRGVEAVIEKDYVAALLAREIGAAALLLLTDVDAAYEAWGTNFKRPIRETMPEPLRKISFAAGSMKPKIEAACRFVESGSGFAGIGLLEDAVPILEGRRGTVVRKSGVSLDFISREPAAATPWWMTTLPRATPIRQAQSPPTPQSPPKPPEKTK